MELVRLFASNPEVMTAGRKELEAKKSIHWRFGTQRKIRYNIWILKSSGYSVVQSAGALKSFIPV
ncbi:hypothetical protein GBA52_015330 [Prunus armeniaca]|nr:hypothetical protein GBA52_015330 [Prunus armeniaca]